MNMLPLLAFASRATCAGTIRGGALASTWAMSSAVTFTARHAAALTLARKPLRVFAFRRVLGPPS